MELRAIYALALRLHVLPQQIMDLTEAEFTGLLATIKMDNDEQERQWRTKARR